MDITKNQKIILSGVIVAVLLIIYIAVDRKFKSMDSGEELATSTDSTSLATSTSSVETKVTNSNGGGYKIEQLSLGNKSATPVPVPDLNREVVLWSGAVISPEAKSIAVDKIKSLQTRLKTNSSDLIAWIDLGIYQKQAGDYAGAEISWKYVSKIAPADYVSAANLGDLYAYFIKDNGQAEVYYREAIKRNPNLSYLYIQLGEMYRDVFKDLDKARLITNQGLSKIPNDPNLLQFQKNLN